MQMEGAIRENNTVAALEVAQLDLKYESFRLRDKGREYFLLDSIRQRGIQEPLYGVWSDKAEQQFVLLDGFKRYRCAKRLGLRIVPCVAVGHGEADGIIQLLRISSDRSLNILEQARLVVELSSRYRTSVTEIALRLERSKAWVSVRLGIFNEMSEVVRERIFAGKFPVRCYMYTLKQFTRVNRMKPKEVDEFVGTVSGKGLSCRQIDQLAHGYVYGGELFRNQIRQGNFTWALERLKNLVRQESDYLSDPQRKIIQDLQVVQKYMGRIIGCEADKIQQGTFAAEVNLLASGILGQLNKFKKAMEVFHAATGKTKDNLLFAPGRQPDTGNCQALSG